MGFSTQEYWSGLPFPPPGDLPDPVIEPTSLELAGSLFTIEPCGKSSAVKEISIKKRSEMTFILKQTENKEQLQGELPGKDGRTKKSSDTQQSEKKKTIKTKFTNNNWLVPEALERPAKRKAGGSSLVERCVLPDPTLQPWKRFRGKTFMLRILTRLLQWGLWGRGHRQPGKK